MPQQNDADVSDAVYKQLEAMSQRLEIEVAAAVRDVLAQSGYFDPATLDHIVQPIASWTSGLPYEAYKRGYLVINRAAGRN